MVCHCLVKLRNGLEVQADSLYQVVLSFLLALVSFGVASLILPCWLFQSFSARNGSQTPCLSRKL